MTLDRRTFLKGSVAAAGLAGLAPAVLAASHEHRGGPHPSTGLMGHGGNRAVGALRTDDFDPHAYLQRFDRGRTSLSPNGQVVREFDIVSEDLPIEVAPGITFNAWAFNGQVPGPTLRATEGELVRIRFRNLGAHPHGLHFHGFHNADMDGAPGTASGEVPPGGEFTYEFEAEPFGLHLYHCHTSPVKRHIAKGLYGAYIVDPRGGRPEANEMVMVLNGFDTNFDGGNEIYAVNTKAFGYMERPIRIRRNELQRVYLVNATEFDPINSIHTHANFFQYYPTGTSLTPAEFTDTKMLCQGERGILEFRYPKPGQFMFHAHQSEFTELGWSGLFDVTDGGA